MNMKYMLNVSESEKCASNKKPAQRRKKLFAFEFLAAAKVNCFE